jgi:hypothetical protein
MENAQVQIWWQLDRPKDTCKRNELPCWLEVVLLAAVGLDSGRIFKAVMVSEEGAANKPTPA